MHARKEEKNKENKQKLTSMPAFTDIFTLLEGWGSGHRVVSCYARSVSKTYIWRMESFLPIPTKNKLKKKRSGHPVQLGASLKYLTSGPGFGTPPCICTLE
jgi:hypothetical protein